MLHLFSINYKYFLKIIFHTSQIVVYYFQKALNYF